MENELTKCNILSYSLRQDFILNYVSVCLCIGLCTYVQVSRKIREDSRSSRPGVLAFVDSPTWMLQTNLRSPVGVIIALKHWSISPALSYAFSTIFTAAQLLQLFLRLIWKTVLNLWLLMGNKSDISFLVPSFLVESIWFQEEIKLVDKKLFYYFQKQLWIL